MLKSDLSVITFWLFSPHSYFPIPIPQSHYLYLASKVIPCRKVNHPVAAMLSGSLGHIKNTPEGAIANTKINCKPWVTMFLNDSSQMFALCNQVLGDLLYRNNKQTVMETLKLLYIKNRWMSSKIRWQEGVQWKTRINEKESEILELKNTITEISS